MLPAVGGLQRSDAERDRRSGAQEIQDLFEQEHRSSGDISFLPTILLPSCLLFKGSWSS
jgi:hypothetical protein